MTDDTRLFTFLSFLGPFFSRKYKQFCKRTFSRFEIERMQLMRSSYASLIWNSWLAVIRSNRLVKASKTARLIDEFRKLKFIEMYVHALMVYLMMPLMSSIGISFALLSR